MPESSWERWESLRSSPDPDPIEVLHAVSDFQNYFKAIEREATRVARAQGRTWQEIGSALGLTRQAVWQRADSEELKGAVEEVWAKTAEVRSSIGLDPPRGWP